MYLSIFIYLAIGSTVIFALLAIHFSHQESKLRKLLKQKEKDYETKKFQLSMLEYIQKEIDYSLDTKKIVAILSESIGQIIPFATLTTLTVHDDTILFHTTIQEKVSKDFMQQVKKSMLESLKAMIPYPLPSVGEETMQGTLLEYTNTTEELASYFHIPLIIGDQVAGIMTLASTVDQYYDVADMLLLYRTMQDATAAVTKLREVIETEKLRLSSLITSLHDGIIMIDENDILQVINNNAKDILSIRKESPAMFDVLAALAKTFSVEEKIQMAKNENKTIHEKEVLIGGKTVQIDITPVTAELTDPESKEQRKKVIGISLVLHDITIEKSLNQLKEDFTNEVVHELRSPLTAIKASAMLIASDTSLPQQHKKFIDIIVHQSERMLGDITSLLDAAKLETGKFNIAPKATDVGKLIEESVTLFGTAAANKKISLVQSIDEHIPQGRIDSNRITQVINNLISNSMKFTPENGIITINARYHYNEHLPPTRTNPGILISVTDTGVGIPQEKQGILFSKFGQVKNNNYEPREAGTGLGLYVSKGIVEAHGGSMFLQSEEGKGTTISFTVPIAPEKIMARITTAKEILQPGMQIITGVH